MKGKLGTLLAFVVLSMTGLLGVLHLSVQLYPNYTGNQFTLDYYWPGASPEALERQVTAPLEGALSTLQGLSKVHSTSNYNKGRITLTVKKGQPVDWLRFEIATKIRQIYPQLPAGISYPLLSVDAPEQQSFMTLELNGTDKAAELHRYAEEVLKPAITRVKSLHTVTVFGGLPAQWHIVYDKEKMQALGIGQSDLSRALDRYSQHWQVGWLQTGQGNQLSVSLSPVAPDSRLPDVLLKQSDSRLVRLQDIAAMQQHDQRPESYLRVNGRSTVQVMLTARQGVNQLTTARQVRQLLQQMSRDLPASYTMRIGYDTTEYIRTHLNRLARQTGISLLILLMVVALALRSIRYLLLAISSLIVNLLLSALCFYVLAVEVHLYSLSALTVSSGLVLANAIIMIDHCQRHHERQLIRIFAGPVLVTCLAMGSLWLLPADTRMNLTDFGEVLIITLIVSLGVTYWFIPVVMAQLPVPGRSLRPARRVVRLYRAYASALRLLVRYRIIILMGCVLFFGIPVFLLPHRLAPEQQLAGMYNHTMGSKRYQEEIRPYLEKALGGTLRLFIKYVHKDGRFRQHQRTTLNVVARLPNHSTVEQMNQVLGRMEAGLSRSPGVERFITQVFNGQYGSIIISFKQEYESGDFPYKLKTHLIALSMESSGVSWDIYGVGEGFNHHSNQDGTFTFNILMKGYNYTQLEGLALQLKERLVANPRIREVDINRVPGGGSGEDLYAYSLNLNLAELNRRGVSLPELYASVNQFNTRPEARWSHYEEGGRQGILISPAKAGDVWDLRQTPLDLSDSTNVKLSFVSNLQKNAVMPHIRKEDQQYLRQISFSYAGSVILGEQLLHKAVERFQPELPLGYTAEKSVYEPWERQDGLQYALIVLIIGIVFIIGAVCFESFRQPLAMVLVIPFSFAGIFLAFYSSGFTFDQGGYASFLITSSIIVYAIFFIIHSYNIIRLTSRQEPFTAYVRAVRSQIRPLVLLKVVTLAGLLPFLFDGSKQPFWPALALGTIGGLIASLFAVQIILPCLLLSPRYITRHRRRLEKPAGAATDIFYEQSNIR